MTDSIAALLGKLLYIIYGLIGHYGVAIIIFTVLVKLAILPLTLSQNKSMMEMNKVQPKLTEIQKKYPKDKNKQAELTAKLYQEHHINPMMGCLPLLIQMPILFGLFKALRDPVKFVFKTQASYAAADKGFLWIASLKQPDVIQIGSFTLPYIFPIIAALATFIYSKMMMVKQEKKQDKNAPEAPGASMQKSMLYMMPIMILWWGVSFPAGLSIYWAISTLFSIAQRQVVELMAKKKEQLARR